MSKVKSVSPARKTATPRASVTTAKVVQKVSGSTSAAKKAPATKAPARTASRRPPAPAKTATPAPVGPQAVPGDAIAGAVVKAKTKLVRDSFTMPKAEYTVLDTLKKRAALLGHITKKSELLRAGVKALSQMDDTSLTAALNAVPAIKTGRPKHG